MVRRSSSPGGLRPLTLAVVVATALMAPAALSAQAAEEPPTPAESAPNSDPAVPSLVPDAGATMPSPAPAPAPPPASSPAAAPPSDPPPTSVTVSRAGTSASKSVSIVDFAFNPGSITVNSGDTVQWTNNGTVPEGHDVTGDGLDSGLMKAGDSYSHTFSSAGNFSYICTIHPSMTGTVKVLSRSSGGGGDSNESGGGGSSGTDSTGSVTESEAVSSPGAAGTSTSLPASGSESFWLAMLGLALVGIGLALRLGRAGRALRRG